MPTTSVSHYTVYILTQAMREEENQNPLGVEVAVDWIFVFP